MDIEPKEHTLVGGRFASEDERNAWLMSDDFTEFALAAFQKGVAEAIEQQKRLGIICKS